MVKRHVTGRANRTRIGLMIVGAVTSLSCGTSEPTEPVPSNEPLPAVTMTISPVAPTLLVGEVAYLSAVARDSLGNEVQMVKEWSSTNPSVATVGGASGNVTAVGVGTTTVTVSSNGLVGKTTVTVLQYHPAAQIRIAPEDELILYIGEGQRLTSIAVDAQGRFTPATVEWTSENPGVATIGRVDGQVSAIAPGTTTLVATSGTARATMGIRVVPQDFLMQWASTAMASSQLDTGELFSAAQATGAPNVESCFSARKAWLSGDSELNWLEVQYATPVRPSEIRVYEVSPGAIVKAEVKDVSGVYHTVYSAAGAPANGCLRTLSILVPDFSEAISAVRVTVRTFEDWSTAIDAVRLMGFRVH